MAKVGRKPKPSALKVFSGNPGKRPIPNEAQPESALCVPDPPEWLGEIGKKYWRRVSANLHAIGLLTHIDLDSLSLLCDAWDDFFTAKRILDEEGPILTSPKTGGSYQNPALTMKVTAHKQIKQLQALFGMTPSDRSGLNVDFAARAIDDFETFEDVG